MEKIFSEDPDIFPIEKEVINLFDREFTLDLHYRGNLQVFHKVPPSQLIVMYFELMSRALEKGEAPKELKINIKHEEQNKNENVLPNSREETIDTNSSETSESRQTN